MTNIPPVAALPPPRGLAAVEGQQAAESVPWALLDRENFASLALF